MTQANDERAARKQYIRRRQKVVFTITGTILTIALVISLLFFFHVGGLGNVKSAAVQPNYGQQAPCAAQEQDGSKGKYVENRNITVRVLNGTEFAGFAQAVSSALQNREFNTQAAGNYTSSKVERTMIIFGKNAINQAYTVNSNFTDATMVMDDREDMLIDVVVDFRQSAESEEGADRRQGDRQLRGMRYRRQDDRRTEDPRTRRRVICRFFDLQIFGLTSRFRFFTENQDREVNSYIRGLNRGRNPPENTPETALFGTD